MANKILTQTQAKAVYAAMSELNNIGGKMRVEIDGVRGHHMRVFEDEFCRTKVALCFHHKIENTELYSNQAAFAEAYKID